MVTDLSPTKAQEIAIWREFLASLPPCSYLALYFRDSVPLLENAMAQDFSCEPISAIRKAQLEQLQDLSDATERKKRAQEEVAELERKLRRLRGESLRLRDEFKAMSIAAQNLARTTADAHATAGAVVHSLTA